MASKFPGCGEVSAAVSRDRKRKRLASFLHGFGRAPFHTKTTTPKARIMATQGSIARNFKALFKSGVHAGFLISEWALPTTSVEYGDVSCLRWDNLPTHVCICCSFLIPLQAIHSACRSSLLFNLYAQYGINWHYLEGVGCGCHWRRNR